MRKKLILLLPLILLSLALPVSVAAAQGEAAGTAFTTAVIACPDDIVNGLAFNPGAYVTQFGLNNLGGEVEGETFDCGVVVVPENYDEPEGRTIELLYVRLRSSSQSPAADPLIYLAGGPGGSGSHEVSGNPVLLSNLNEIRERRDIIAYDQRGTGYSNYLLCAPFSSAIGVLLDQTSDPAVVAEVEKLTSDPISDSGLKSSLCGGMYTAMTDVDLAQYNSVVSAQDILHLATALGYTAGYNLYGTSYGTRLAQYAMRATPDQVRSVILDGTLPVNKPNAAVTFAKRYEQYLSIFDQCAADAACNVAYPNLNERFGALLEQLDADPIVLDPPLVLDAGWTFGGHLEPVLEKIDVSFFVKLAALNNVMLNGGGANLVPRLILALEEGEIDYLRTKMGVKATGAAAAPAPLPAGPSLEQTLVVDQPLFQAPLTTLLALAQIFATEEEEGLDVHWVSIVLTDLQARLLAGGDQDDLIKDLITLSVLPNVGVDAQLLSDFATAQLSEAAAQSANALVAQMTRDDVRKTMWTIQDIAMKLGEPEQRAKSDVMQNAVNCAEDMAFSSLDDAQTYLAVSPYPQLVIFPLEYVNMFFLGCTAFPTPLTESVREPVVSDIPTLIFQEALDVQTPLSWGVAVKATLRNAYFVEWRNMGHIAAGHDTHRCAGDIAAAFFDDPAREPKVSCAQTSTYALQFELPE